MASYKDHSWVSSCLISVHDLPASVGRKIIYADHLAILHYASDWKTLKEIFTQDIATLFSYLYLWKLKLSTTKLCRLPSIFTTRRHDVSLIFLQCTGPTVFAKPTYLGIKLDRALTFCRHSESLRINLTYLVGLL